MARNKKFTKSIFFILLCAACLVSINSIIQIQKYGHWINYLGIVRGASQRAFKLEITHKGSDDYFNTLMIFYMTFQQAKENTNFLM